MTSDDIVSERMGEQMELALRRVAGRSVWRGGWRELLRDREERTWELVRDLGEQQRHHLSQRVTYILDDAIHWLSAVPDSSLYAIVTDPPYGVLEYEEKDHEKLRAG